MRELSMCRSGFFLKIHLFSLFGFVCLATPGFAKTALDSAGLYDSLVNQPSGDTANPLRGELRIHDPSSVIRHKGVYYVYQTYGGFKTSKDRIRWKDAGKVFDSANTPAWWKTYIKPPAVVEMWAGDISYWNGTYYFYYSVSAWLNYNSCIGLATNTTLDPADPNYLWVDKGVVIDSLRGRAGGGNRVNVIDPHLFQNTDGKKYLSFGSYEGGLRQVEINPATGKLLVDPPAPTTITTSLGEASFLLRAGSYYYFAVSRGTCCAAMSSTYNVVYGRATSPQGPFLNRPGASMVNNNYNSLLAGDAAHPGRGGQSFFVDNDTLFMVYHVYTYPDGRSLLNIKPVYRDGTNWLTMNPAQGTVVRIDGAALPGGRAGRKSGGARLVVISGNGGLPAHGRLFTLDGRPVPENARSVDVAKLSPGIYLER